MGAGATVLRLPLSAPRLPPPTFRLVQELLAAKRDLKLPRALRKLDLFDILVLDDIGYVQQNRDETEVLFNVLAERRSNTIASNPVFSSGTASSRIP